MEHNSNVDIDDRPLRIPPIVWVLGIGLIVALVAIFVFKVAIGTVAYYGFFALMMGSHFFMHGSHGGHGGPAGHQHGSTSTTTATNKDEHSKHTGGCH
jgi:hypothetical protein